MESRVSSATSLVPVPSCLRSERVRRATSLVLCMAVVVGLLCLAAAWGVPWALKAQLERRGSEALGRAVTVGRVDFRPWSLELSLHDVAIASSTGTAPQAHIKRIYIDAAWRSLGRWAPVVDALEIDAPMLRVTRMADGRSDIDDLVRHLLPDAVPTEPAAPREPARFALYNISLHDGSMEWTDDVAGRVQSVQALELTVPFLSTLAGHRDVVVKPRLAFLLNGSPFETTAEATPFAAPHRAAVRLQVRQLDLAAFAAHGPRGMPLRLQSGRLDADLRIVFEQAQQASAKLTGSVAIHEGQVLDGQAREVIGFDALRLHLQDVQPLQRKVVLESVEWDGLRAELRRAADGRLEWPGPSRPVPAEPMAGPPVPTSSAAGGAAWTLAIQRVAVANGRVGWTDRSMNAPRWEARHVQLLTSDLTWPLQRPVRFRASAVLPGKDARLALAGEARSGAGHAAVSVAGLPLEPAAPFLRSYLRARLGGTVDADLGLAWKGPAMVARVARLAVNGLALDCGNDASAAAPCVLGSAADTSRSAFGRQLEVRRVEATDAWVRWPQRMASVGVLKVSEPRAVVSRDAQGHWMFEAWRQPAAPIASAAPSGDAPQPTAANPWQLRVDDAAVEGGSLVFRDQAAAGGAVSVQLSSLQMRVRGLSPLPLPGGGAVAPSPFSLSARIGSGRFEPGRLSYDGTLRLRPLELQGKLQAGHLPLQALEPYVADRLKVRIARAEGSFAGDLHHAQGASGGSVTALRGDLSIDEVRVTERGTAACSGPRGAWLDGEQPCGSPGADDLLRWKTLGLRGLQLETAPDKPWSLQVRETALSDFFARAVLQENGRLNLQDLLQPMPGPANGGSGLQDVPKKSYAEGSSVAAAAPRISFGPITLTGGSVAFSDRFVKPNYSTDLSELAGRLGAFASASTSAPSEEPQMADLQLRGKAEGTASVDISGKLNLLARPLALDIQGRMRDLELPPLSPYSVKYAGHAIERGKLAVDVNYRVRPDGQLTASNRVVLRQLVFGDPVEGAPASLPVRLAAALLADGNGVIDVDLPISGSLNDPEFRLSAVIWRVLGNMVLKAVTSPFSLLAGAFGGSEELERIEFLPGGAALDAVSRERLDKIARALADRPSLTLTVVGEATPDVDQEGWKRQRLHDMVLAERRRAGTRVGQGAGAAVATASISPDEYDGLLKEVYRRADMPKPRNLIGLAKEVPPGDMERLLLAHIAVPPDAMRALAVARSAAARDYLAQRAVPLERLFVGAPRLDARSEGWTPRASMTLQTR